MLATIPKGLPSIADARLPEVYENAKHALENCASVDECKEWANKAEALASYARQAGDEELFKFATRIKARAIRRCGELIDEIPAEKGGRPSKTQMGTHPGLSPQKQAAQDAGLSDSQRKTALNVYHVPREEFEGHIESDNPPSVTALAEIGKNKRLIDLGDRTPEDFKQATALIGLINYILKEGKKIDVARALGGCDKFEKQELIANVGLAIEWLTTVKNTR